MTQKELKALYTEELKKVWSQKRMVDYCNKKAAYIVEHEGRLYSIDKPEIKKEFCFSAGYNGGCTQDELNDAAECVSIARQSEDYFRAENLREIDQRIEKLKQISRGSARYSLQTQKCYYRQPSDCKLSLFEINYNYSESDKVLAEKLIAGYEEVRKAFIKRLDSYLKRYGLSKIRCWSYVSD